MAADHVLLYDADCGFCRWSLDKILQRDKARRIRPVPLQSAEADVLLKGMDHERKMASWHLVKPDGSVYSAGAAVAPLLRLFPKGTGLATAAAVMPPVTGLAYRLISRNRTRLGKLIGSQACSVDPSERATKR